MEAPGTNYQYIAFNLKDPVFSDLRVRKAIAHAIDREKIIKYLWRGSGAARDGSNSHRQLVLCGGCRDLSLRSGARARAACARPAGPGLSFTFRTSTDETTRLLATVFQQQLKEVGIQMNIQTNEPATFSADIEKRKLSGLFPTMDRR